jgi:hypothetical protein
MVDLLCDARLRRAEGQPYTMQLRLYDTTQDTLALQHFIVPITVMYCGIPAQEELEANPPLGYSPAAATSHFLALATSDARAAQAAPFFNRQVVLSGDSAASLSRLAEAAQVRGTTVHRHLAQAGPGLCLLRRQRVPCALSQEGTLAITCRRSGTICWSVVGWPGESVRLQHTRAAVAHPRELQHACIRRRNSHCPRLPICLPRWLPKLPSTKHCSEMLLIPL